MSEGTVTAVGPSRTSGKPTVTIDGQIYSATQVKPPTVGDRISFEAASKVYNGATVWFLNDWKLLAAAQKYPPSQSPVVPIAAPSPSHAPTNGIQDVERPCISNWGAELIKAGLVKDPADLGRWVIAIKNILRT